MSMPARLDRAAEPDSLDYQRYQVDSRFEIVSLLREVADAHALVTLYFNQGSEFIVTNLLDVNPELDELIFDFGAYADTNQRLLSSPRMTVVTFLDHIKLQFSAQRAEATSYDRLPALRIGMPDSLLRLQRRDAYRIRAPIAKPVLASISDPSDPLRRLQLRILDVSCGGIAVVAREEEIALEPGMVLQDCSIDLPGVGLLTAALEVRNTARHDEATRQKMARYGCRFSGLSPVLVNAIQRYITKVERERAQRL